LSVWRVGRRAVLAGAGALVGIALLGARCGARAAPPFFSDGTDFHDRRT
jgi:hypothetical protein